MQNPLKWTDGNYTSSSCHHHQEGLDTQAHDRAATTRQVPSCSHPRTRGLQPLCNKLRRHNPTLTHCFALHLAQQPQFNSTNPTNKQNLKYPRASSHTKPLVLQPTVHHTIVGYNASKLTKALNPHLLTHSSRSALVHRTRRPPPNPSYSSKQIPTPLPSTCSHTASLPSPTTTTTTTIN